MSEITKHYRVCHRIFLILSLLLNICPLAVYVIKAIVEADLIHEKVTLTATVFAVLILTCVSLVNKVALRSRLWILLCGIYICLDNILGPLIVIAVCQVLDELLVSPLKKSAKTKLVINKQIDRRG